MFLKRPSERVQALGKIPLFRELSRSDLEEIAKMTYEVERAPGELLLRQGDVGTEMMLLLDGTARVELDGRLVDEVTAPRAIGEMALIDKYRRSASVTAITPCTALVVPYDKFWTFLETAPKVQKQILVTLSKRVRDLLEETGDQVKVEPLETGASEA